MNPFRPGPPARRCQGSVGRAPARRCPRPRPESRVLRCDPADSPRPSRAVPRQAGSRVGRLAGSRGSAGRLAVGRAAGALGAAPPPLLEPCRRRRFRQPGGPRGGPLFRGSRQVVPQLLMREAGAAPLFRLYTRRPGVIYAQAGGGSEASERLVLPLICSRMCCREARLLQVRFRCPASRTCWSARPSGRAPDSSTPVWPMHRAPGPRWTPARNAPDSSTPCVSRQRGGTRRGRRFRQPAGPQGARCLL